MDRRTFLKMMGAGLAGSASGTLLKPHRSHAQEAFEGEEFFGILIDTTRCIGCRRCEKACAEVNNLPVPDISKAANEAVFKKIRKTSVTQYTVTNLYETEKGNFFVPWRCLHCNLPACRSACLVYALQKRTTGHVTWDTNCMGCRLCMVSCPFDIPKFEYQKSVGNIQKCNLCYGRFHKGIVPGCVEACPTETLMFGSRRDLLEEGWRRISQNPDKYVNYVYGQYEVGGTSHLYLSAVPFEQIGLRMDLGVEPYPKYSLVYLNAIPFIATLTPIFMLGIARAVRMRKEREKEEGKEKKEEKGKEEEEKHK
jgi:formate dehydrogenase iron-sulfur subunit